MLIPDARALADRKRVKQRNLRRRAKEFIRHFQLPVETLRPLYKQLCYVPTSVRAQEWRALRGNTGWNPVVEAPQAIPYLSSGLVSLLSTDTAIEQAAWGTYGTSIQELSPKKRDALRKSAPRYFTRTSAPRPGRPPTPYPALVESYFQVILVALKKRPSQKPNPSTNRNSGLVQTTPFRQDFVDTRRFGPSERPRRRQVVPHSHGREGPVTGLLHAAIENALFATPAPGVATLSKWITRRQTEIESKAGK